jgi:hypothetical protein
MRRLVAATLVVGAAVACLSVAVSEYVTEDAPSAADRAAAQSRWIRAERDRANAEWVKYFHEASAGPGGRAMDADVTPNAVK